MANLTYAWWRGQMDLAGFPPHVIVFQETDWAACIFGQLKLMGDRGF